MIPELSTVVRSHCRSSSSYLPCGGDMLGSRRCHDNHATTRRSRLKNRARMDQMVDRCGHLRKENALLETKVDALIEELDFLKQMFLTHASGKSVSVSAAHLARVMTSTVPGPDISHVMQVTSPAVSGGGGGDAPQTVIEPSVCAFPSQTDMC